MTSLEFFKKNSLTLFFILSYILMIAPTFFHVYGILPEIMLIIMIFSPTISGLIMSFLIGGKDEVKKLLKGYLIWRVGIKWYLAGFIIIIYPLILAISYLLITGSSPTPTPGLTAPIIIIEIVLTLVRGPLSEEGGWRGFALPRLQAKYSALMSSLILSIIWACWHIPLYFIEARLPFYIFIGLVIVITILMTWAYNNTKGSLIITMIFHFSFNLSSQLYGVFGLLPSMIFYIGAGIGIGIYVIVVVIYTGPKKLSRKQDSEMPFMLPDQNTL